jgi:DNA-binding CsgD family transcriptional regulator
MYGRPTAVELLDAVQRFLDEEVVPHTDGRRQFLARVSANVLRMLARELQLEETHLDRAWTALDGVLGPAPRPCGLAALRAALQAREAELCARIRAGFGDTPAERARLVACLRQTVQDKLAVTDPGYFTVRV